MAILFGPTGLRHAFLFISILAILIGQSAEAQIACPAMGLTQVNSSKKDKLAGFSKAVRSGKKKSRMGNYFSVKTSSRSKFSKKDPFAFRSKKSGRVKEHSEFNSKSRKRSRFFDKDEFATRSKKKGRFRSYDEFATRKKRSRQFRDFDEFAYRSRTRSGFFDKDEFATKRKHGKRVNIDSQFSVNSTEKRFRRGNRLKSGFSSKKKRSKKAKSEYTPFASSRSPFAGEKKHREPQMGLWGGTVGNRGGKENRKMTPLPEPEKKGD